MKNTGTLRIQTFAARQSAPVEGVTVAVQGDGFTLHRITDATGSAADIPVEAPACTLSLDEDNTTRPYAIVSLTAAKPGYRTVRIEGIQIFAGQVTLAQPQMLPVTEEDRDIPNAPIIIPPHALFAGSGGSGPQPALHCTPRVLDQVVIPKNITVHLGKPAAAARNVTVSFRDYIANVASSEVYPTWAGVPCPTTPGCAYTRIGRIPFCGGSTTSLFTAAQTFARVSGAVSPHNSFCISASASAIGR